MIRFRIASRLLPLLLTALVLALPSLAQQGNASPRQPAAAQETGIHWPVAVRWWGQGFVTIETWWGLTVAIDPYDTGIGYEDPDVSADLVLITHAHKDHNNPDLVKEDPKVFRGLGEDDRVRDLQVALDRKPNEEKPTAGERSEIGDLSEHAVTARTIASFHDDQQGAQRGHNAMWLIETDGVRILHMGDFGQKQLTSEQRQTIGEIDVLLIPVGGVYTVDGKQAAQIVEQINPRIVVPIHYKTEKLNIDLQPAEAFTDALPQSFQRAQTKGNTLAAAARDAGGDRTQKLVVLDYRPWEMPAELAERFERMDAAQKKSREVFAPLSAGQMNFRPSNGTHTPRWNVEHMNGYALSMFSGFFNSVDPEIARITERPEQMPPDYVPANPTWTGAEEARQVDRTRAFAKRFAYLLDGKPMDATVEGVRLPLGRVFEIQERHYNEHTGNVVKKFDLPDWPNE